MCSAPLSNSCEQDASSPAQTIRISCASASAVQLRISQPAADVISEIAETGPDYNRNEDREFMNKILTPTS